MKSFKKRISILLKVIFLIIYLSFSVNPGLSYNYTSKEYYIKALEDKDGKIILEKEWRPLYSDYSNRNLGDEFYVEQWPKVAKDRVHARYKIILKSEKINSREIGCRRNKCHDIRIKITEFDINCLALDYIENREWNFYFYRYYSGVLSRASYYGEIISKDKKWKKINTNNFSENFTGHDPYHEFHKQIADAICDIVLPIVKQK